MKTLSLVILFLFITAIRQQPVLASPLTVKCSNIKGASVDYKDGDIEITKDGFSGQTIIINLPPPPAEVGGKVRVQWKGRNNFKAPALITVVNKKEGIIFFSEFAGRHEVGRSYAFFLERMALTFAEQQTRFMVGNPQIRALTASCRP